MGCVSGNWRKHFRRNYCRNGNNLIFRTSMSAKRVLRAHLNYVWNLKRCSGSRKITEKRKHSNCGFGNINLKILTKGGKIPKAPKSKSGYTPWIIWEKADCWILQVVWHFGVQWNLVLVAQSGVFPKVLKSRTNPNLPLSDTCVLILASVQNFRV